MYKLLVAAAACLLALCLTAQRAYAQDVHVCPPGTPAGDNSKCQGYSTIQDAINHAPSNSLIRIPGGEPRTESGITIVDKDLTISGDGARTTIVQAASAPCALPDRVFHIDSSRVTIQDLTIQNGCVLNARQNAVGGGIWSAGSLTLERVIVRDNAVMYSAVGAADAAGAAGAAGADEADATSTPRGGGIYAVGSLEIIDSTIMTNTVSSTAGQAFGAGVYNNGTSHIVNSTISGNWATGMPMRNKLLAGGGVFNAGTLVMEYSTVVYNRAVSAGGGLYNTGKVELINNLFYNNSSPVDQPDCTDPDILARAGAVFAPAAHCDTPVDGTVDLGDMTDKTPTPVYIPARNSASVDAAVCANSKVQVDQRGNARGQGNECDLGAVELGFTYMPVLWSSPAMPDLIVRDIIVEPAGPLTGGTQVTIKVVIENIGNKAATGGFYVDLFINPKEAPPNRAGYTWADFCRSTACREDEGIVWVAPLTIDRGEQFVFTSDLQSDPYVVRLSSQWDKYFTPGEVKLWAYVDSYEVNRSAGGYIEERREDNNRFEKKAFTVLPGRIPDAVGSGSEGADQVQADPFAPRPQP